MSKNSVEPPQGVQPVTYHAKNIRSLCDLLAARDPVIRTIIANHGYPKMFSREPGFAGLIRLILEQQVSLMSAKAAYLKLLEKVKDITPENILRLSDDELRECYFSRQKSGYAKSLADALTSQKLRIHQWVDLPDEQIRNELVQIKGIGDWTADNYLLLGLRRVDVFPVGDIALVNSIVKLKKLPPSTERKKILKIAEKWRPYRSIAAILFWHAYLSVRKIKLADLEY